VAVFSWLTGLSSLPATLVAGQLVNSLAVLALYPLAVRVSNGNRWAGAGAVVIAGLLSPMPGYYLNWGRYAQLAGMAVLPAALWLFWESAEPGSVEPDSGRRYANWRAAILAGLALGGMTLSYYRMPFYAVTFMIAWLVAWGLPRWRLDPRRWGPAFAGFVALGALAASLFLPWLVQMTGSYLASAVEGGVTIGSPVQEVLADFRAWLEFRFFVPRC
jgi:hypothetical protein